MVKFLHTQYLDGNATQGNYERQREKCVAVNVIKTQ